MSNVVCATERAECRAPDIDVKSHHVLDVRMATIVFELVLAGGKSRTLEATVPGEKIPFNVFQKVRKDFEKWVAQTFPQDRIIKWEARSPDGRRYGSYVTPIKYD